MGKHKKAGKCAKAAQQRAHQIKSDGELIAKRLFVPVYEQQIGHSNKSMYLLMAAGEHSRHLCAINNCQCLSEHAFILLPWEKMTRVLCSGGYRP